jgi:hypothetical protein
MTHDTVARAEQLLELRELVLALSLFNRAESEGFDPDRCAAGRWMVFMLCGDYTAAWRESDAIRARCRPDVHRYWQGEDLHGRRVLVRCLHGFGDSVQMLRFVPALKELGVVRVIVECAPHAVELVKCMSGIDEVITWGAHAPPVAPEFDVQVEIMELPYIVRATVSTLPSAAGILRLPVDVLQQACHAVRMESLRPRVGLVWSAGEWNPARSVPLELLTPILHDSTIEFWNLQGGSVRKGWYGLPAAPNLRDMTEFTDAGLVRLSALIAQLDLVITVDTLAAHLAGTLNVPCFLLLQHAADWRWMIDRADSPWYPSLRLFRQPRPGDWQSAVMELNTSFREMVHSSHVEPTVA